MKLIAIGIGCALVTLTFLACNNNAPSNTAASDPAATNSAGANSTAPNPELASARTNYEKNCTGCHGPKAEGGTAKVNNKQIKVPSLKSDRAMKHDDQRLTETITNGEEEMPSFKDKLKAQDIADLVKLIRKDFQGK
ncbi:MAG TPA: cytochrome c [Pyrinomonadaceae bacterium]|nr:cytochrome c [Pyrinomonadaceae bacterium]